MKRSIKDNMFRISARAFMFVACLICVNVYAESAVILKSINVATQKMEQSISAFDAAEGKVQKADVQLEEIKQKMNTGGASGTELGELAQKMVNSRLTAINDVLTPLNDLQSTNRNLKRLITQLIHETEGKQGGSEQTKEAAKKLYKAATREASSLYANLMYQIQHASSDARPLLLAHKERTYHEMRRIEELGKFGDTGSKKMLVRLRSFLTNSGAMIAQLKRGFEDEVRSLRGFEYASTGVAVNAKINELVSKLSGLNNGLSSSFERQRQYRSLSQQMLNQSLQATVVNDADDVYFEALADKWGN